MSGSITDRRQKRMGPAPFASFEDLSDEVRSRLESPEDARNGASVVRLPGIREDATPSTPSNTPAPFEQPEFVYTGISLVGAATFSSPSPAMARLTTPNTTPRIDISRASSSSHQDSHDSSPELFEAHDPATAKLGLGFREEGALDLRSSTEELDFQDAQEKKRVKARPQSPSFLHDDTHNSHHQRKDSQSSELGLLCISGRTSRLSSIGSQGSGHSRLSNASHLSVISGQSRSPSPHKMLLETSFCGTKPPKDNANKPPTTNEPNAELEKVLLARKQDPTEAVFAEGICVNKLPPDKPVRKVQSVKSDITIKVDEPSPITKSPNLPKRIVAKSGVEYIYIPLKGPLPVDSDEKPTTSSHKHSKESKATTVNTDEKPAKAVHVKKGENPPKYIRIKLKPDYMYSQEDQESMQKPETLDLRTEITNHDENIKSLHSSPKLPRTFLKEHGSKTPSPSLSRKSSFASLFRSKETIMSPESPTIPCGRRKKSGSLMNERSRSRSKSRERAPSSTESIDSKTKPKSVFSIFKPKKPSSPSLSAGKLDLERASSNEILPLDAIAKVEFKFNDTYEKKKYYETPLKGESIRIPLHSPTHEERDITIVETPKSEQIETVVLVEPAVLKTADEEPINVVSVHSERQNSTSSENVVFTTNLGSNNEIFSTKFPKKEPTIQVEEEETISNPTQEDEPASCYSSESERDSEIDSSKKHLMLDLDSLEPERKTLVLQDSYDDELPYIPTTLPMERSSAIPIVPVKQRSTFEMKTCPIERPRSTTPINPSCLEEYCEEVMGNFNTDHVTKTIQKLKISLPKHDSIDRPTNNKSPRKPSSTTNWFEFAERGISGRRTSLDEEDVPPPLPPKGIQKEWINFEEIPERRKPPKRIQTLPSRGHIDVPESLLHDNVVVYNYANPEECKCECHENKREVKVVQAEDEVPLLEDERFKLDVSFSDRRSLISDSSMELSGSIEPEINGALRTPFTSDLGVQSNRSSIVSQDEPQSPDPASPNAFPKTF